VPENGGTGQTLRHVADQLRQKWPKLDAFIDDSDADVLSYMDLPPSTAPRCIRPIRWSA
jgi:hypothetical protein